MKKVILGLLITNMLTFCSSKKDTIEAKEETIGQEIKEEKNEPNDILGVWTDGSGPNASFRIEKD
jgi:hypothetical protein